MNKRSLTITTLIITAILFVAHRAGVSLTEGQLQEWISTGTQLLAIGSWIVLYVKRLAKGDVNIFGAKRDY